MSDHDRRIRVRTALRMLPDWVIVMMLYNYPTPCQHLNDVEKKTRLFCQTCLYTIMYEMQTLDTEPNLDGWPQTRGSLNDLREMLGAAYD